MKYLLLSPRIDREERNLMQISELVGELLELTKFESPSLRRVKGDRPLTFGSHFEHRDLQTQPNKGPNGVATDYVILLEFDRDQQVFWRR